MQSTGPLPPSPVHTGFAAFRRALPYLAVVVVVASAVQAVVDTFVLQPRIDDLERALRTLTSAPTPDAADGIAPLRAVVDVLLPSIVVAVVVTVVQLAFTTRLALSAVDAEAGAAPRGFGADVRATLVRLPVFSLWMLVAAAAVYVGLALCILPGLLVMWALALLPFFVIDRGASPVRESVRAARAKVVPLVTVAFIGVGGLFLTLIVGQVFAALPFAFGRFGSLVATGLLLAYVVCALGATYRMPVPVRPASGIPGLPGMPGPPPGMPEPPPPGTQVNPWESIPPEQPPDPPSVPPSVPPAAPPAGPSPQEPERRDDGA